MVRRARDKVRWVIGLDFLHRIEVLLLSLSILVWHADRRMSATSCRHRNSDGLDGVVYMMEIDRMVRGVRVMVASMSTFRSRAVPFELT